ncbi:hypothetical protein ACFV42_45850 [Streptomyces solisilvae]|uniref:hypothetical protein n=1 Tax=Streptomyces malaysiensis TaxID=92644 RepID=UPI00368DF7A1
MSAGDHSRTGPRTTDLHIAAPQFHAREGHLQLSKKAVEIVDEVEHKIGLFVDNARSRADKPSEARRQELTELGVEWA